MKFVVSWAKDKATLDEFLLVLQRVFSNIRPFLTLEMVCHSQLEFLCSLPRLRMAEFTQLTKENEAQLLAEGIVEIFIGEVQLLKVCAHDLVVGTVCWLRALLFCIHSSQKGSLEATTSKPLKTGLSFHF